MRIALLGVTGAGKSTLAAELQKGYGFASVSTGDYVRKYFPQDPLSGGFSDREKQIREYVDQRMGEDRIVLDGFPRHLEQLVWLCKEYGPDKLLFVVMRISFTEAKERVTLRGREDLAKFPEQFRAQMEALRQMDEYLNTQAHCSYVVGPLWSPDLAARMVMRLSREVASAE